MMRSGMTIESIIDATKGVKCAACTKAKGGKRHVDGLSCGDIIARTIQEEYELRNNTVVITGSELYEAMKNPENWVISDEEADKHKIKINNNTCPECGVELANEGGCVTCKNCGYSKCD